MNIHDLVAVAVDHVRQRCIGPQSAILSTGWSCMFPWYTMVGRILAGVDTAQYRISKYLPIACLA